MLNTLNNNTLLNFYHLLFPFQDNEENKEEEEEEKGEEENKEVEENEKENEEEEVIQEIIPIVSTQFFVSILT